MAPVSGSLEINNILVVSCKVARLIEIMLLTLRSERAWVRYVISVNLDAQFTNSRRIPQSSLKA